jgi:hypothetical protein
VRLREAESLARAIGDEGRLGWVSCYLTHYFTVSGDPEHGVEHGNRAISIAQSVGDFPLLVATCSLAGVAYAGLGDYASGRRVLSRCIEAIPAEQQKEHFGIAGPVAGWCRNVLLWCVAETGDFAEGLVRGKEALCICSEANYSYAIAGAYFALGYLEIRRGGIGRAVDWLERALGLSQTRDLPWTSSHSAVALTYVYAVSGRLDEARALLSQASQQMPSSFAGANMIWIGQARFLVGDTEAAIREATHVLDLSRKEKTKGREAWALHLIGEIEAAKLGGDPAAAERAFRDSLALAAKQGMRPLQAHCHLGLGKLFAAAGDKAKARDHLGTACALMREMEMGIWLEQAEAALAGVTA